VKAKLNIV